MKSPPHPGEHLLHDCIEPLGLTVAQAAGKLGVSRQALTGVVAGRGGITAELAVRLSKAFGGSPDVWLGMQMRYDLAEVMRRADEIEVVRLSPEAA